MGPSPDAGGGTASTAVANWWMCCRENRVGVNLAVERCFTGEDNRIRFLNQYIVFFPMIGGLKMLNPGDCEVEYC